MITVKYSLNKAQTLALFVLLGVVSAIVFIGVLKQIIGAIDLGELTQVMICNLGIGFIQLPFLTDRFRQRNMFGISLHSFALGWCLMLGVLFSPVSFL
jgi:hypothetical protein